jgi:hypothetical protein
MKVRKEINNINDLITFIEDEYDNNRDIVIDVIEKVFNVVIITFSNETKEQFTNRVNEFYKTFYIDNNTTEKPNFLMAKYEDEFNIKNIFY